MRRGRSGRSRRFATILCAWVVPTVVFAPHAVLGGPRCARDVTTIPEIGLQPVVSGLTDPVFLTHDGDRGDRLYVVEQAGVIRVIENGRLLASPFLDIRDRVASGGETGLLSVAFHPHYADNGYFYVDYTTRDHLTLYTVVSRFRRSSTVHADVGSEAIVLKVAQPFSNHNGGQVAFGPDGLLYIGMGDGGAANDPFDNAQNLGTLLGALLRIDVDRAEGPLPYAIPDDNPFRGTQGARTEIWAYGLRNPWRFAFDSLTGGLYVADVGQDQVEEIDVVEAGGNYGWDIFEGDRCRKDRRSCANPKFRAPIQTYQHPQGMAVTGGYVYRGAALPQLCGVYVYGDYVTGRIWALIYDPAQDRVTAQRELLRTSLNISSFGTDRDDELYVLGHRSGVVMRVASKPVARP
jgi:glucose/arabinose dehydrogenase